MKKKTKAFNYDFFAWDLGPLSKEIYLDHKKLADNNTISQTRNITLSKKGKKLLEDLDGIYEKNREILRHIDKIVDEFADLDTNSIVEYVHDMKIKFGGYEESVRIGNLERGTDIISKIDEKDAKKSFEIDESWIETLEILMDKEFCEAIEESQKDAREGRIFTFEGGL